MEIIAYVQEFIPAWGSAARVERAMGVSKLMLKAYMSCADEMGMDGTFLGAAGHGVLYVHTAVLVTCVSHGIPGFDKWLKNFILLISLGILRSELSFELPCVIVSSAL